MNLKKIIKRLVLSVMLTGLGVGGFVLSHYFSEFDDSDFKNISPNIPICGVVFGAKVKENDIPSEILINRLTAGETLFQKGIINCLILSGGESASGASHEVDVMKKILSEKINIKTGIYPDFILDYNGDNTEATIRNLQNKNTTHFVFISNDFHLARIKLFAWKNGVKNFSLHAAEHYFGHYKEEFYYFCRENVAIAWYFKWKLLGLVLIINLLQFIIWQKIRKKS